jgi:hypothetical protein
MNRRPNNFGYCDYVDKLFGMNCFGDIAALGVVQSAKDVSESMAALQGVIRHGKLPPLPLPATTTTNTKRNVVCLCIGDGTTPRSAVLAAFTQPQWLCVSIDPALQETWSHNCNNNNSTDNNSTREKKVLSVRGLIGYRGTLEQFMRTLNDPTTTTKEGDNNENDNDSLFWSQVKEEDALLLRGRMIHNSTDSKSNPYDYYCQETHRTTTDPHFTATNPDIQNDPTDDDNDKNAKNDTPLSPPLHLHRHHSSSSTTTSCQHLVILCVHSHARLIEPYCSVASIRAQFGTPPSTLVSLPCCATFRHTRDIGTTPDIRYDDDCVFSAQRTVEIWNYD